MAAYNIFKVLQPMMKDTYAPKKLKPPKIAKPNLKLKQPKILIPGQGGY